MSESISGMNYGNIELDDLDKTAYHSKIFFLIFSARTALYPLSVIKTRLQYQDAATRQYSGQLDVAKKILKNEGFRGFYKGYPISLISLPASLAYIEAMEHSWHYLPADIIGRDAISGLIACTAAQLIFVPSDVLSQRQQIDQKGGSKVNQQFIDTWRHAKNIANTAGLLGFYRGFSISMMTYGPQASLFWTIFGSAENRLSKLYMRDNNSQHMLHATSAGISSILTNLVITPLDTVRCRYQLNPEARSIRTICTDLFRNEGFRGFYKGWAARTLQNFINAVPVMTIWMWIRRTSIKRKE